jgi:hypothetical protein
MPNNLDSNVSQIVLKKFLPGFMSDLVLAKTVDRQLLAGEINSSTGDSVSFKRPHQFSSLRTPTGDISGQNKNNLISGKATGRVGNYITVAVEYQQLEEAIKLNQLEEILAPVRQRIVTDLETELAHFMMNNGALSLGSPNTPITKWSDVAQTASFLKDLGVNEGENYAVMDPQRLYNLQVSMLADTAAQDPGQIPIVGMEQIRGLEKHWEARNKKRPAFLPLREVRDKSGNIIAGATPAGYTQPAVMNQALAALLQQTSADIQEVTGGSQAMQQMPSNIAQETVNNLMNRADMASFIYLDNMAKSLKRAGEVWLSMAREVYGSEREVRIVNEDGSDDIAVLSAQVVDRQTGAVVALNDLSVGRYDVTVDVGPSYTARRDATVSVLTNVLSSMLPTDPMRPAIQGIILDNIDGEGLDDFKEYNRNQLLISGIAKPRNEKEQQIVQQAQMAAQSQPNPEMVLAQAQMVAAQAEAQKATNETAQTQIKAFTAQQDAMESQANTVYKLAQARNIDDKAVMEAIRLLKDVAESQQQQFQSPPQSPADLMPS